MEILPPEGEAVRPHPKQSGPYRYVRERTASAARAGVGFGSALAITISWSAHQSIFWAVIHGFFSWLYVLYFAVTR
jgi:hypothetical protein